MNIAKGFILMVLICFGINLHGQRFSFLAEVGGMRTQIDGDKIQGFHNNGYIVGIGTNYTFTPQHFIAVKSTFYNQGSRRKDQFQPRPRDGFQLEVDLRTIGIELSYKYDPSDRSYFLGAGLVRHQIVNLKYDIIDNEIEDNSRMFESDQLRSGFTSIKFYYGFTLLARGGLYFSLETSVSDIVKYDFFEVQSLIPYSLAAVFTYEIKAAVKVKRKSRPGSKSRKKN